MKPDRHGALKFQLAMLLLILACALPGLGTRAISTANPKALATIIAGTAAAAAAQTAALPQSEPPGERQIGTQLETLSDGTTRFIDYDGNFELAYPAGWLAVRPNSDEFNATLEREGARNARLHDQMLLDMDIYESVARRLLAYPIRPDIEPNTIFGFSRLAVDLDDAAALDSFALSRLVTDIESSGAMPGFRIVVAQVAETGHGLPMLEISGPFAVDDGQGGKVPFYTTIYFFKPGANVTARLTFSILQDYQELISADVRSVIDSAMLLEP